MEEIKDLFSVPLEPLGDEVGGLLGCSQGRMIVFFSPLLNNLSYQLSMIYMSKYKKYSDMSMLFVSIHYTIFNSTLI